ncbi:MAG: endonuclease MutS2 [Clostridia bacterium]|nr:endonuclease MutS2 [Clostridia bacterium]
MNKKSTTKLELDKIINMVAGYCMSESGKGIAQKMEPMTDLFEITSSLEETDEGLCYLENTGTNPVRMFGDIISDVNRAKIGACLHGGQLLSVASFLGVSREVKSALEDSELNIPILKSLAFLLAVERFIENEIKKCILSEEDIADDASEALYNIRRNIRKKQSQIRDKMDAMLKSSSSYLQESIITMRSGRYVIPVKAEYKSNVKGIVHDVSSSGSTVFIEPIAVVELNNDIRQLEMEEQKEIQRILQYLSSLIMEKSNILLTAFNTLSKIDWIFAKAKLAQGMDAIKPEINDERYINIIEGRHPLIDKNSVVPINIWCGKDFDCLIVTGPNTGGKTVSLKTCGLFVLMTQSGMLIPAKTGTTLPIFESVYSDIGDEQSIEQSLSTFSSHMKNIVSITETVDDKSLVLLDELGAGTDPTEGAALAISILENLISAGAVIFATTHYSELKAFALTQDRVENAAMEFDVKTLSPTYKMGIGIPGKSNAFEISRHLGLNETIIKRAREHIDEEGIRFEDIIQSAERNRQSSLRMRKEAEEMHADAKKLRDRHQEEWNRIYSQQQKEIEKAKQEANRILQEAKDKSDDVIKRLKELEKGRSSNLDRERQEITDSLKSMQSEFEYMEKARHKGAAINPEMIEEGQNVRLIDTNTKATVIKKPDSKGKVQVQAGIIKLMTDIENIEMDMEVSEKKMPTVSRKGLKTNAAPLELDIRGCSAEEGIMQLDLYLDNAFTSHLPTVQIIHGKGTGILRSAVHRHLKSHPHVSGYRLGKYGEGEDGVTVVTLK